MPCLQLQVQQVKKWTMDLTCWHVVIKGNSGCEEGSQTERIRGASSSKSNLFTSYQLPSLAISSYKVIGTRPITKTPRICICIHEVEPHQRREISYSTRGVFSPHSKKRSRSSGVSKNPKSPIRFNVKISAPLYPAGW